MRVLTHVCLALGALLGSAARPSPAMQVSAFSPTQSADEAAHKLDVKPFSPCAAGLRVWVRADDLRPSSISEGDARLINNLTHVAHDAALVARCRVTSWTLGLRHRERAALKFPAPDVELPAEPQWNYTWGDRYNMMQGDEGNLDTVFSPHTSEKQAYDAKLEEYARAIRNHDHWVVMEEQRLNFETEWPMGTVEEPLEDLQIVNLKPFAVAVPAVVFPATIASRPSGGAMGTKNISYAEEIDLTYFARVTLSDNEVIEVAAGETTFVPPASWPHSSLPDETQPMSLHFDADTEVEVVRANGDEDYESWPRLTKLEDLDLTVTLDVPVFVQGDTQLLNGTFIFGNKSYEVDTARFTIKDQVRPTWAVSTLKAEERDTCLLVSELHQQVGVNLGLTRFGNWGYSMVANSVPIPAAAHLENAIRDKKKNGNRRDDLFGLRGFSWGRQGKAVLEPLDAQGGTTAFTTWANFSDSGAFTTREAAFETVEATITVDLTISERTGEPQDAAAPKPILSRSEQMLKDNKEAWQVDRWNNGCCDDEEENEPKKPEKSGVKYNIRASFEGLQVLPRAWPDRKRDVKLQQVLQDRRACEPAAVSHFSTEARSPMFVDPKMMVNIAQDLCSASSRFPRLNATTQLRHRRPAFNGSDSTLRFVSNRWRHKEVLSHEVKSTPEVWRVQGSSRTLVGKVWAEKVLLPIVNAEKEAAAEVVQVEDAETAPQITFASVRKQGYYEAN